MMISIDNTNAGALLVRTWHLAGWINTTPNLEKTQWSSKKSIVLYAQIFKIVT